MMIATVVNGMLEIHYENDVLKVFKPMDVEGLSSFIKENRLDHLLCSSSVDFPEEDGLFGVDVRRRIDDAFK